MLGHAQSCAPGFGKGLHSGGSLDDQQAVDGAVAQRGAQGHAAQLEEQRRRPGRRVAGRCAHNLQYRTLM